MGEVDKSGPAEVEEAQLLQPGNGCGEGSDGAASGGECAQVRQFADPVGKLCDRIVMDREFYQTPQAAYRFRYLGQRAPAEVQLLEPRELAKPVRGATQRVLVQG
jgi:hypothetical protein